MNKIAFILEEHEIDFVQKINKDHSEYVEILKKTNDHFTIKNILLKFWESIIEKPEYFYIKSDDSYAIKSSDYITIATIDSEDIAKNIVALLNLAFREGSKKTIKVLGY